MSPSGRDYAMIVCNARSGSTFLALTLNEIEGVCFDYEFVCYPTSFRLNPTQLNVPVGFKVRHLLDGFGHGAALVGSKLVFGYSSSLFAQNSRRQRDYLDAFIRAFDKLRIIWITRHHFDLLVSYTAGPIHQVTRGGGARLAGHLMTADNTPQRRFLSEAESHAYLTKFLAGDILCAEIARRNASLQLDYVEISTRFPEVVDFLGFGSRVGDASALVANPPVAKLGAGDESLIEHSANIREMAKQSVAYRDALIDSGKGWRDAFVSALRD